MSKRIEELTTFDPSEYLTTEEVQKLYIEEAKKTGDQKFLSECIEHVEKAKKIKLTDL
ncbi:hypothetical protein [Photobacterium leiognathi]|uniref:hypothetical protein n=1 Tax=Photobacterium leiognathi TaxID=553611 RepID=UPI002982B068|nr:hypothetical protein [Photobacterium leiognathi]